MDEDEMGLTPEAARGYEAYFVPAIFQQWPSLFMETARIQPGDSLACPFAMGEPGRLDAVLRDGGFAGADVREHEGTASFPSLEEFVATELDAWLLAGTADTRQQLSIAAGLHERHPDVCRAEGPVALGLNALLGSVVNRDG